MRSCVSCGRNSLSSPHLTFHAFPKKLSRAMRWLENLGLKDFHLTNWHCVCSDHFAESDYRTESANRRLLYEDSEPKLFEILEVRWYPRPKTKRKLSTYDDNNKNKQTQHRPKNKFMGSEYNPVNSSWDHQYHKLPPKNIDTY